MLEDVFDPKDQRNIIDKIGAFDVFIMFAWGNDGSIPSAARIDVANADRSKHFNASSIRDTWSSYEDAVAKTKRYAKLFADDLSKMKPV
ncbi:hypothetical protein [Pseudomonas sp. ICMP 561]|uniref:hypothetical protein n=1 Tax=Pseudomonas sp. ICMP 561 TaxID=1718918 RepID=UPI000C0836A4|nr:hypothetical protein [Pseudomonas sp. ICMP 561]PHN28918.1 hypothetical protein AO242_25885 [Pseudomonas sp. ICMP 561]